MEYREVLAFYLEKQKVSVAELARRISSPRSTIYALLGGRAKEPTLGTAKAIADALGVTLQEMADMVFADEAEIEDSVTAKGTEGEFDGI